MQIHLSNGVEFAGRLTVVNVTGVAEERGFRLFWADSDGIHRTPALGYATSNPFRTEGEARAYAMRMGWGRAVRRPTWGR